MNDRETTETLPTYIFDLELKKKERSKEKEISIDLEWTR